MRVQSHCMYSVTLSSLALFWGSAELFYIAVVSPFSLLFSTRYMNMFSIYVGDVLYLAITKHADLGIVVCIPWNV